MRKLLQAGLLVTALAAGCESSKLPTGPGTLVLETSTSTSSSTTTTAVIPGLRYVASPSVSLGFPNLPADMTIFLQPTSGGASLLGSLFNALAASTTYNATGIWNTSAGLTGEVKGVWVGTIESGEFRGTLTAKASGCTAEREYSGPIGAQYLQWTAGAMIRDCAGSPLSFSPFMLLKSDAGPPVSTSVPSTTSTTTTSAPVCTYALTPTFAQVGAGGGTFKVVVSAPESCTWVVQSTVEWIVIQSPLFGNGDDAVTYLVKANPGAQRTGALVAAGITMFVVQSGN